MGLGFGKIRLEGVPLAYWLQKYRAFLLLMLFAFVFAISTGGIFLRPDNLVGIILRASIVGTIAIGQTIVILTSGIDLSVGSLFALCIAVISRLLTDGFGSGCAVMVGILAATLGGIVNGTLVSVTRIPPFVITLGTQMVYQSLALTLVGAHAMVFGEVQDLITGIANFMRLIGLRPTYFPAMVWLVCSVIMAVVTSFTTFGHNVYALGGSRRAAIVAGVRVRRICVLAYALSGFFSGIAAVLLAFRLGGTNPYAGQPFLLDSIAAAVIGGVGLQGGEGTISGTILGSLILAMLVNYMNVRGVDPFIQDAIRGTILLLAVFILEWLRHSSTRRS